MSNPINIEPFLAEGHRYVFYKSLLNEYNPEYRNLGTYAQKQVTHFHATLTMKEENRGGSQIMEALAFLRDSAEFERQKELNFFQHYTTAHPEIQQIFRDLTPKQIQDNYTDFIININRAIKGTTELKKMIHSEYTRISENRKAADDQFRKGKKLKKAKTEEDKKIYEADIRADEDIQRYHNSRVFFRQKKNSDKSFFNAMFQNSTDTDKSVLANIILTTYGAKLFGWNRNGIYLDERQKNMLIATLTMKANELFVSDMNLTESQVKKAQTIITSQNFQKMVDTLLNSPHLLEILDSLCSQYNMQFGQDYEEISKRSAKITNLEKAVKQSFDALSDEEKRGLNYDTWRQQVGLTKNDIRKMIAAAKTIHVQTYYVGEDISLVDWIMNGLAGILGGGKNPTDDIEAGTLITTIELDQQSLDSLEQKLWESQSQHFKKIGATSTYQTFLNNTEELLTARKEQENLIQQFLTKLDSNEQELNDMLSHINIHSTVKGYQSAGSYEFEKRGGFGGAAFGATLDSELKIIDSMAQAGGLSKLDIDKLYVAMINCGRLMIGEQLKTIIENYFSAFMGMLMFNDAQIFAQDVKRWLSDKTQLNTVQDLHMYQLNGLIVPSSYILQETYNAMSKLQDLNSMPKYRGIKAVFSTYDKGPIAGDWEATSRVAIEQTKLERMHFLAGFVDLLEDIENRLKSI